MFAGDSIQKGSFSLRDILVVFFKHKITFSIALGVTVITIIIGTFLMTPVYEAHSLLLLKFGREYVYLPEVGDSRGASSYFSSDGIINAEIRILTSQDLAEKLIEKVGLAKLYPALLEDPPENMEPMDRAILNFKEALSVQGIKESNMIEVSFEHEDPEMSAEVVNTLIELFKDKHLQTFNDPATGFLKDKMDFYQRSLQETEDKIVAFKQKYRTFSFAEQQQLLLRQRSNLDAEMKNVESQEAEAKFKLIFLEDQLSNTPEITSYSETENDAIVGKFKAELLDLKLQEQELLNKFTQNNRQVINVRKKIQMVENFLEENKGEKTEKVRVEKSSIYQDMEQEIVLLKAEINAHKAGKDVISGQLEQIDTELSNLTVRWKELQELERELTMHRSNYQTYAEKFEEKRISNEMDEQKISNIRIIQAADVPLKPVRPNKKINIGVGIILGLFIGSGLVALCEFLGQGLSTPESAERRLGLPVLASVPFQNNPGTE